MHFDLCWRKENFGKLYGIPPDMANLAYDVHGALQHAGLFLTDFKVLGMFSLDTRLLDVK